MARQTQKWKPTRKVSAGLLAGSISTILVFTVSSYVIAQDQPKLDAAFATALTTVITFVVQFFVAPDPDDDVI